MSETCPSVSWRICKSSFKVKFGSLTNKQFYSSWQNLFKPSQRKDSFRIVLADVCCQVGLVFSDREYNPCGSKIVSLGHLFKFVKAATFPTISGTPIKVRNVCLQLQRKQVHHGEKRSLSGLIRQKSRRHRRWDQIRKRLSLLYYRRK